MGRKTTETTQKAKHYMGILGISLTSAKRIAVLPPSANNADTMIKIALDDIPETLEDGSTNPRFVEVSLNIVRVILYKER